MGSSKKITFENVSDRNGQRFNDHVLIDGKPVCGAEFNTNVAKVICRLEDPTLTVDSHT